MNNDHKRAIEAIDPKSGTAEFKASAVRIEKLQPLAAAGG